MVEAGSIWIKLGLNTDELRFGLDKAKYGLMEWRDQTVASTGETAKWGLAIGLTVAPIVAAGAAAYATIEKFGGMAQELKDLNYVTGLSTDKLQQLQYAATISGTAFPSVTMGVQNLTLAVAKARDTSSDAGKAFAALNISTDGRTYDQIFEDTATALVGMKDETARNELAAVLLGKSWRDVLPFLQTYIDKKKEIQSISLLTPEELAANEKAKQDLDALGKKWETLQGKAVAYFATLSNEGNKLQANSTVLDRLFAGRGLSAFVPDAYDMGADPGVGRGADRSTPVLKNPAFALSQIDPFAGMTSKQAELKDLADFTLPKLTQDLKDLQASGTASYSDIADASLKLIMAKEKLIELSTKETDAQKGVTDATKSYTDAIQGLQDLKKNEARELSIINPRDVSAFRTANIRNQWAEQDQVGKIGAAQSALVAAGGKPAGDLIINIDGKMLAKIPGVATTVGSRTLMQAGY